MQLKPTIFLCDDNREVLDSLSFHLQQAEFEARAYPSGESLLQAINAEPKPLRAIFVLDIKNPPMDGDVIHDHLIEMGYTKRSPVIFLTGEGTIELAVAAVRKGALDFLRKPHTPDALLPLLHRAVELEAEWLIRANRCDFLRSIWTGLAPQKKKVAKLTAESLSIGEISRRLGIVESTVEKHRQAVFESFGVDKATGVATTIAAMKHCGIDVDSEDPGS